MDISGATIMILGGSGLVGRHEDRGERSQR
jgi:hypothetical protein